MKGSLTAVPINAAYAYDAVTVIVKALVHYATKLGLKGDSLKSAALNGSVLFSTIIEIQNFSSRRISNLAVAHFQRKFIEHFYRHSRWVFVV